MDLTDILTESEGIKLLEMLLRLTKDGRVAWVAAGPPDKSSTNLGSYKYLIFSADADGLPPYALEVFEKRDRTPTIAIVMRPAEEESARHQVNSLMRELFEIAFRQSRRAQSKIEDVMSELEQIDRGETPPI